MFDDTLSRRRQERLIERFGELVDADDKRIPADKALVEEMRGTLGVLGLVRVTENAVHLVQDRTLQELEQRRLQKAVDAPTVGQVRDWLDENDKMGLQPEAEDLVVRCYARWASRTFTHFGKPVAVAPGTPLPADAVLEKPDLPGQVAWNKALATGAATLGMAFPNRALHADNLKRFEAMLGTRLEAVSKAATALPAELVRWAELLGVSMDADRLVTARSGDQLCAALVGQGGVAQVEALAAFEPRTSAQALGASLHAAPALVPRLADRLAFGVFTQLSARASQLAGAAELLEQAAAAVRQDELHIALGARLRELAEEGQRLLSGGAEPTAPPAGSVLIAGARARQGRGVGRAGSSGGQGARRDRRGGRRRRPGWPVGGEDEGVMSSVPELTTADVRGKLEELLAADREHYVFALYGRGDADRLTLNGAPGPVDVIPVASELDLRRRLLELGDGACAAFLVPFDGALPMDLRVRFAQKGRVLPVGRRRPVARAVRRGGGRPGAAQAPAGRLPAQVLRRRALQLAAGG